MALAPAGAVVTLTALVSLPAAMVHAESADVASLFDLSLQELMNLQVVTVSRHPEKLAHTTSSIQVITREEIRRSGATTIPEALRLASNLTVAQQNAHEWIISARGFSSDVGNKLLVLVDGRTVYTPLFSGVFWQQQDYLMEDIERIEVISGPGGTLWGANAVNGVINIITRSAADTQGWYGEAAAGDPLNGLAGVRYGDEIAPGTHFRVYGKARDHAPETLSNNHTGADGWRSQQGGFRIDGQLDAARQFTLQGDFQHTVSDQLSGDESTTRTANILGRWQQKHSADSTSQLQLYFDRAELTLPVPATVVNGNFLAVSGEFRDSLDTVDLDFQNRYAGWARQAIVWGFGYRHIQDSNDNTAGFGFLPDDLQQDLLSAFVQDDFALVKDVLTLTLGTKVEHNDYTGREWEPSVRLGWSLDEHHMLWSAVSRSVRMPARIDRDIRQPVPPNFVVLSGSEDFESEVVRSYELGYRGHPVSSLVLSLALFHNRIDDLRSTSLDPVTVFPLYFANNLEGTLQGVELDARIQAGERWRLHFGYTWLDSDIRVKAGEFDFNNALNETADPAHQFMVQSFFDLGEDWELDLMYRWVDRLPTNNVGELVYVPQYRELDLHLGWQPTAQLELALVGQNLLHDHHQEFGVPDSGQEEVGRSLFFRAQWRN